MSTTAASSDQDSILFREALTDVHGAHELLQGSMNEESALKIDPASAPDISESQIEILRNRARRERARGIKGLEKRHEGVASIMINVVVNERVTASAFERWFASIENGIFVMQKRGHMFVGEKNADALMAEFTAKVATLEEELKTDLAGVETRLDMLDQTAMIVPEYASPASARQVQLRTPLSNRVLKIVTGHDKVLSSLVKLQWNGEIEQAYIEEQENKAKQGLRDLAKFLGRAIRGMKDKVAKKEGAAPAEAANSPEMQGAA